MYSWLQWNIKPDGVFQGPHHLSSAMEDSEKVQQNGNHYGGICKALSRNVVLSILLIFIPIGIASHWLRWEKWLVFLCNFLAILPMAWLIGKTTEDLSASCGDVLGALLNATFGNVVEMMLCVAGIQQNQIDVVQCTLVGSILSNMLLVMGTSFLWGGYWRHSLKFSEVSACTQSSLLLLSVLGIALPTLHSMLFPSSESITGISRGCAILFFLIYLQYLAFQLRTHVHLFQSPSGEGDDEEEEVDLSPRTAAVILAILTVLTSFCSEYLIASIEGTVERFTLSKRFVGIVLLPIIGNAAEHWTAISVAGRGKMDLSLGVAVGSSCQMALFVTPFTVGMGWLMDRDVTLDFRPFQAVVLCLATLIVSNILKDGESNWLEGSMLTCSYLIIAVMYFFESTALSDVTGGIL